MAALQACNKEPLFSEKVEAVSISNPDNALRILVDVDLKEESVWHVEYWPVSVGVSAKKSTGYITASAGRSRAVVKFLYPQTEYQLQVVVDGVRGAVKSKVLSVTTGSLPPDMPIYTVDYSDGKTVIDGYLMQWEASSPGYVTFCDYNGNVVWYQAFGAAVRTAVYDPQTGRLAVLCGFKYGETGDFTRIASDIFISDLDGNTILRRKSSPDFLPYAHHELTFLPNDQLLCLQNYVKNFDGVDVYGDGFQVMDYQGNVSIQWDCFNAIDPTVTDYVDMREYANDYLHANSVAVDSNGDFYMTFNRITELWKISGKTGEVLYRVGRHGDVRMKGGVFDGGLHAAVVLAPDRILCYANKCFNGTSSAVVFEIDPETRTGEYRLLLDLPSHYSSKNRSNVNFIDDRTLLFGCTTSGKAVFMDVDGKILRVISRSGISYRAYWFMPSEIK